MTPLARRLIGLAALAVLAGIAADALILTSHDMAHVWAAFNSALGGSFVATGLYAWWRRPDNRSGRLLTWVGFLWFLSALAFSNSSLVSGVGQLTESLPIAGLVHLLLAVPGGRLQTRYRRALVALAYANCLLFQLPGVLRSDDTGENVVRAVAVALIALVTIELVRARGQARGVTGPLVFAGAATLTAFAALYVSAAVGGAGADVLLYGSYAVFVTVPYAFLAGVIRARLSRAEAVAQLVAALGRSDPTGPSLRDALADALGDSSLTLAYWIPQFEGYADADGRPVALPEPGSGRTATPIERGGAPLAAVLHDAALAEERDLVHAVGGAAALTLENERLRAELRARVEEVSASRARIVQAGDEERRRLERDLHDGAQQRLVSLALSLKLARNSDDPDALRGLADDAITELTEATAELRELARGIHPGVLTHRGLGAAVTALATRSPLPVEVRGVPAERLAAPVESTAYFVVAEALTNVARYARASHAEIEIGRRNGTLVVEVRDDGVGGADPAQGSGLRGLADRVAAVDGRLTLAGGPGAGTVVRAEIPCAP